MRKSRFVLGAALCLCAVPAFSVPIINVGTLNLSPNTPGQVRDISVSGGDAVLAETFNIQIGTAGGNGATAGAPKITAVNIIAADTIFGSNNNGQGGSGKISDQLWEASTATSSSGSVLTSGILAHVTFDTTGITTGSFVLRVKPTAAGDTEFTNTSGGTLAPTVTNGFVNVPEPTGLAFLGGLTLLTLRRRRR